MYGNDMKVLNIEKGMFQYFLTFSIPNENKIQRQLSRAHFCHSFQDRTDQYIGPITISHSTNSQKKVTFSDKPNIKTMHVWQFAHTQARKGEWQQFSIDRMHFKSRIYRLSEIITPILKKKLGKIIGNKFEKLFFTPTY